MIISAFLFAFSIISQISLGSMLLLTSIMATTFSDVAIIKSPSEKIADMYYHIN